MIQILPEKTPNFLLPPSIEIEFHKSVKKYPKLLGFLRNLISKTCSSEIPICLSFGNGMYRIIEMSRKKLIRVRGGISSVELMGFNWKKLE